MMFLRVSKMAERRVPFRIEPQIVAVPFSDRSRGRAVPLLTPADKEALSAIGTVIRVPKGGTAYRSEAPADNIYNLVEGVLKTVQVLPDQSTHISGFHFAGDLFGLAEQGKYIDSAEAIVPVVAYQIPRPALEGLLTRDGGLAVRILCKLADELRKKNRHALILDREDAVGKIAMFLLMLEDARQSRGPGGTVYFPMMRLDVAKYVGLTLETVSRAFHLLERLAIVKFIDRHHFHVLDRERLEALSAGTAETIPTITPKPKPAARAPAKRRAATT
jgi:CRP-like cAMP-binding protein